MIKVTNANREIVVTTFAMLVGFFICNSALAQSAIEDRWQYLEKGATTTDDPRRIPAPDANEHNILVLTGGRIFDGTGAAVRTGSIVIEGKTISRIASSDASEWPEGALVIDVGGKTVMPGLIDLHTHLTYTEQGIPPDIAEGQSDATLRGVERLRFFLESGITSVRDVASHGDAPFRLKEWVAEGRLPGPRIFAAGQLITGTGGHGAEPHGFRTAPSYADAAIREASGPDDWRNAVREQFKRGADLIKLGSHYSEEEVRAAVDEAHALGLKVTVDAETFYIERAVEAGVDIVEHPLPRSDRAIKLMTKNGTAAVPTLIPYIYIIDIAGGYYGSTSRRFTLTKESNLNMLRRLREADIKIGVGTDLVMDWFRALPEPYIEELKQYVAVGYTISEALVAATKTNAEILDMGDKLGTIEAGKLADIIVIDGRPDANLDDLANVHLVVRNGRVVIEDGQVIIPRHKPKLPEGWK